MRGQTLRDAFPLPLVAISVLLLTLIALTPNLVSTGTPTAGSFAAEAELLVDRAPGENSTHFYVRGIEDVRYASISASLLENTTWPPPAASSLHFGSPRVTNDTLMVALVASSVTVAVNVTASYVDANGVLSEYIGLFEFRIAGGFLYAEMLAPTLGSITTAPEASLPISFLLEVGPTGGGP